MKWIDDNIPALDRKAPREAARDPNSKQQLISLLNDIQCISGQLSKVFRLPIERIKKGLGL